MNTAKNTDAVTVTATATVAKKSQKGKWGHVGAPPKTVKLPRGNFTMHKVYELNPTVCKLTCRKDVLSRVEGFRFTGTGKDKRKVKVPVTLELTGLVPQPDGKVGRPSFKFGPKVANAKPVAKAKSVPVANVTATAPAAAELTPTPAVNTPVTTEAVGS